MDISYKRTNETWKEFRQRVLKLQSAVNKRLKRIEENKLTDNPTYRALKERLPERDGGGVRFSMKGKNNNELTSHYWQLINTYNSAYGSVQNIRKHMESLAKYTGINIKGNTLEMTQQTGDFFKIADTISDYLDNVGNKAQALDYRRLHTAVREVIQKNKVELSAIRNDAKQLETLIRESMKELGQSYADDIVEGLSGEFNRRINATINIKL